jgi:hypothetical protein
MKDFGTRFMFVEKHEAGQSRHNYLIDFNNDADIFSYQTSGVILRSLIQRIYEKLKTKKHGNSQRFTQCTNKFITKQLKCVLPWLEIGGNGNQKYYILQKR